MQTTLPSDINVFYISTVIRDQTPTQDRGSWGFYWINGSLTDIPKVTANADVTDNTDVKPSGSFAYHAQTFGISYANWLGTNLSYGFNTRGYFQEFTTINQGRSYGISFSPSLMWMPTPRWVVGSVIQDLIASQVWETGTQESILPEWRLGVGYVPWDGLLLAGEIKQKLDHRYSPSFHLGTEVGIGFFRIRGGLSDATISFGCGLYTESIDIQYAYLSDRNGGIGDNHRISLGFGI